MAPSTHVHVKWCAMCVCVHTQGNDLLSGKALAAAKKAVQKSISARLV